MIDNSRIGVVSAHPDTDPDLLVESARRAGAAFVHLTWARVQHLPNLVAALDVDQPQPLEVAGMPVGGLDVDAMSARGAEDFEEKTDEIYMQMQSARRLGLSAVSIHGGAADAAARQHLIHGLRRLALLADRLGIEMRLCNRRGTCCEQPSDYREILAEVAAENLAVDLDIAECHRACVNPTEPIWGFERRISAVRWANVSAGGPAPLEDGEINVRAILDALRGAEFDGPQLLVFGDDKNAPDRLMRDVEFLMSSAK